jgi:hypothetical protein
MSNEGEKYCLLLAREQKIDIAAAARITAEFFNAPLPEIALSLRKGHGFLASDLPKVVGAEMQRRLDTLGVETVLLPTTALEPLPHPTVAREMELSSDSLSVSERKDSPPVRIAYAQIMLLSVCEVFRAERPAESDVSGSKNLRDTLHKFNPLRAFHETVESKAVRPKARLEVFLNIFTKKPHEYYRISREEVGFRGLGEMKSPTARENFRAVLEALVHKSPTAYVTILTRRFLAGAEPQGIAFADLAEVNRYHAWLLNVLGSR